MHPSMRTPEWEKLRRGEHQEVRDAGAIIVVPIAATEQHGPHLPVNTDTAIITAVAKRAAELVDEFPVVVAPAVPWGISHHHMIFPGSITIRSSTMVQLLEDLCSAFHQQGYRKIFLLNSHGGNLAVLSTVVNELAVKGIDVAAGTYYQMAAAERAEICEVDKNRADHAGEMETSLGLFLEPDCVDMSLVTADVGMPFDAPQAQRVLGVTLPIDWHKEAPSGATGTPQAGEARKGELMVEQGAEVVARFIRQYAAE